jgi:predicted nuclease of predicted toxin-antitoxin system
MNVKLDENFDLRLRPILEADGHDVDTVLSEALSGSDDDTVYATCRSNRRVLITLDLDFSNPFRFPPDETEGIVVVRPPRPVLSAVRATLVSVLPQLKSQPLKGMLWIVEPGRIRVFDPRREGD